MKRDGRKIAGVVVYDYQMAQIADQAGVDLLSVGDSVGTVMWGHADEREVTVEQMLMACRAVRRGATRAVVSCDLPLSSADPVGDARRLIDEGGAEAVKVDASVLSLDSVRAIASAGIPVWPQMSGPAATGELVAQARQLADAGAAMLDFRHSGPDAGAAVARAVAIPVIGGLGGGPWLDGRVRALHTALGYQASALEDAGDRYANLARAAFDAIAAYAGDVRAARQVRGK